MRNRPSFETERLRLRPPTLDDAEAIYRGWATDREVTRYVMWRPHVSTEDTRAFLRLVGERWDSGAECTWLLCPRAGGAPIGAIAFRRAGFKAEIGYVLARPHWGQGYMAEAARKVIDIAFADPAIERVGAYCDVANLGSARVMEKIGMSREGVLKSWLVHPAQGPAPRDCFSYAITRLEWESG